MLRALGSKLLAVGVELARIPVHRDAWNGSDPSKHLVDHPDALVVDSTDELECREARPELPDFQPAARALPDPAILTHGGLGSSYHARAARPKSLLVGALARYRLFDLGQHAAEQALHEQSSLTRVVATVAIARLDVLELLVRVGDQ